MHVQQSNTQNDGDISAMFTVEQTIDVCEVLCCPALTTGGSTAAYAATSPVMCCAVSEGSSQSVIFDELFYGMVTTYNQDSTSIRGP